ncbi:hypothetical protein R3P38DRAFT_1036237 [Favolaschia claudopus]|uniref:Secreted protein n=1 Tax=Favolaschia claudopus TaxID=2862362 RepID=A0AAW0BIE0_9AGAR
MKISRFRDIFSRFLWMLSICLLHPMWSRINYRKTKDTFCTSSCSHLQLENPARISVRQGASEISDFSEVILLDTPR